MKLIISGGGTGGHVYPALAVVPELNQLARQLRNEAAGRPVEILWIGSVGGMEQALVERAGLNFKAISASGLRGKSPAAFLGGMRALSQGYRQSRQILGYFQPDVLFVTGGYVGVPVALAARRAGVPIIIYLPDIEPGLAIKFLARLAIRVAVTAPEAQKFFRPGLTVVTGYPVRPEFFSGGAASDREGQLLARRQLGLAEAGPVLMVSGGSRGARSINQAISRDVESYLALSQVIHVTGELDIEWVQARRAELPANLQARYRVSAYLHDDMITALRAADLVIARAGASVLGEFPAVGAPAVLVPYPYAGAHQALNADYLARHTAAVVVKNEDLDFMLKEIVTGLLANPPKLQAMRQASKNLARPDAAARLAQQILEVGSYGN